MKFQGGIKLVLALCCCAMLEGQYILGAQAQQDPKKLGFFARLFGRKNKVAPAPGSPFDDIGPEDLGRRQAWGDVEQVLGNDPSAGIPEDLPPENKRVSFDSSIVGRPLSPDAQNKEQVASFRQAYIDMYNEDYAGHDQSANTLLDWYNQRKAVLDKELLLAQNMRLSALKLEGFRNFSVLDCLNLRQQARTKKEQAEINQAAMQVIMDNLRHYDELQMKTIWSIFFPEPFVPKPSKKGRGKSSIFGHGTIEISPLDQAKSELKNKIKALGIAKSVEMVREFQSMLEAAVDVLQNKQKALSAARSVLYNQLSQRPIALSPQR